MNKPQGHASAFRAAELAYMAIAASLIALCSWISIPSVVPFTLQTFGVFITVLLLGGRNGTMAVLTYLLLGAIGVPVFAGFSSGFGALLGNTGGYLLGFLLIGPAYCLTTKSIGKGVLGETLGLLFGLVLCYALGTAWFMIVYTRSTGPVGLSTVLSWCVLPFILPDLCKMALAVVLAGRVRPSLARFPQRG